MALSIVHEIYYEHGIFGANAGQCQMYRNNDVLNLEERL